MEQGEMRNAYKTSAKKPEEKRALQRPPHPWSNGIKLILKYINIQVKLRYVGVFWIDLAQNRDQLWALVKTRIKLQVYIYTYATNF
jgi:hypothetical protein